MKKRLRYTPGDGRRGTTIAVDPAVRADLALQPVATVDFDKRASALGRRMERKVKASD